MDRYIHRIGITADERAGHSLRHGYIIMKFYRADPNVDRVRMAVGDASSETIMEYGEQTQFQQSEVDRWPDSSLPLRHENPGRVKQDGIVR
jgi:hypothetical protein